tara:strand:- start:17846 stop:18604 length:759 start_codon:yes stop_codon:yes gene_type:complete
MTSLFTTTETFPKLGSYKGYDPLNAAKQAQQVLATFEGKIEKWTQNIDQAAESFKAANAHLSESMGPEVAKQTTEAQNTKHRADLVRDTRDEREALVAQVAAIHKQSQYWVNFLIANEADQLAYLCEQPDLRKKYSDHLADLKHATPQALKSAAQRSVGTQDWAKAGAIVTALGMLPDEGPPHLKKPFDPNDLATAVIGVQFKNDRDAALDIAEAVAAIENANSAFVNNYQTAGSLINAALNQRKRFAAEAQ